MRLVALRYFLETARLGSIRRAAEVLNVAQSALSRQIALLEEDFGTALFERAAAGVRLTEAGACFAEQARATLKDFERLRGDLDELQQLRRGTVRIGSMEGAVPGVLYRAVARFGRDHPGINYEVRVGGSEIQLVGLARQELDLAILFEPPPHPDVVVECAVSDPTCAVVCPAHPLASRRSLRLGELTGERLALPSESFVSRMLLDRAAAHEQLNLPAKLTINHIFHAIAFARQGLGVAFAPQRIVREDVAAGRLAAIPIEHPLLASTRTALCRHRFRVLPRAAQGMLALLKEELLSLNPDGAA